MLPKHLPLVALLIAAMHAPALSGTAEVEGVTVRKNGNGTYNFDVTIRHEDTGWDHYANRWEVVAPDGTVLGTRVLHHPHVDEQPFTRSLSGVEVPEHVKSVVIRAHDSVHKLGGKEMTVELE